VPLFLRGGENQQPFGEIVILSEAKNLVEPSTTGCHCWLAQQCYSSAFKISEPSKKLIIADESRSSVQPEFHKLA